MKPSRLALFVPLVVGIGIALRFSAAGEAAGTTALYLLVLATVVLAARLVSDLRRR
jgi:hypothetical protein